MSETYQCMEVWGGNQPADNGVVMPGVDAWVLSRPFEDDDAGGDVHYVSSCATGRITRFLVADVSGHGTRVAQVATVLRTLMRRYINFIDQSRLVRHINDEFSMLAQAGCFATAVVATYFTPTGYLTLCNAGHPRPFHYDSRRRMWRVLERGIESDADGANIPLGIAEGVSYDQMGLRLSRGDVVLFYTDALAESMDASGNLLGEAGLLRILKSADPSEMREFLAAVLKGVEDHGGRLRDDATILAFRPNAMSPRASLGDSLAAGLRFVKLVVSGKADSPAPWPQLGLISLVGAFIGPLNRLWGGRK